jgi:uncharacterized protein
VRQTAPESWPPRYWSTVENVFPRCDRFLQLSTVHAPLIQTKRKKGWNAGSVRYSSVQQRQDEPGHLYFEIQAENPQRAIAFYSQVFGWTFSAVEGLPVPYWRIETGGARGGLLQRPAKTPPSGCGTNAFVCSMEIEDFDATEQIIRKLGGVVAFPKFAVPGRCWQGYFVDTGGNTFGIFRSG